MSTAKFEKLIDLIINEDQERAEQLFHEIVVEKSREIYESLMDEDMTTGLMDEISSEEEGMDGMMEDGEEDFEDTEIEDDDITVDDGDEEFGDEESEEEYDDEEDMDDMDLGSGESVTKDDIMNLEDKLDQLMAEFEAEFGGAEGEEEVEMASDEADVMEAIELKKVAGLYGSKIGGDNGSNAKSPVVANSGAKGPVGSVVKPVKFAGDTETAPTGPKGPSNYGSKGEKTSGESYQNGPSGAKGVKDGKGEAAPKPKTETVSAKSPVAEGRTAKKRI